MGHSKLSDTERLVLAAVELRADAPLSSIARECCCRESTVRTILQRLRDNGLIATRRTYINPYLYGYTNYAVYLAVAASALDTGKTIAAYLSEQPRITWLAELGGEYQLAFSLSARHISSANQFIERLTARFPGAVLDKDISIRSTLWTYPRKYLSQQQFERAAFQQGGLPQYSLDESDVKVLRSLSTIGFESFRRLADRSGLPSSTFFRRIKQLEQRGIIQGHYYILDVTLLGRQEFRLLLSARGGRPKLPDRLQHFAASHTFIRKFVQCLGSWEYELELDVPSGRDAAAVVSELCGTFSEEIGRVRLIPLLGELSCSPFPSTDSGQSS